MRGNNLLIVALVGFVLWQSMRSQDAAAQAQAKANQQQASQGGGINWGSLGQSVASIVQSISDMIGKGRSNAAGSGTMV